MKRLIACLLVLLPAAGLSRAACEPEKLVKIVYRDRTPGISKHSFEGQPVTVYRLGANYGRIEEASAPEYGRHSVRVTNEPDNWTVNLLTGAGTYEMNRTGKPRFRAPVFDEDGLPDSLRSMEFGCEIDYVKQRARADPHRATIQDVEVTNYEFEDGAYRVRLAIIDRLNVPFAIGLYRDGELIRFLGYIVYRDSLPPDTSPFWPPANVEYTAVE